MAKITPIKLYRSSVPGNVPSDTNLGYGELAINYADGDLYFKDSGGVVRIIASTSSSSSGFARTFAFMGA